MSIKGQLVPAWTLGFDKGGFRCKDCHMKVALGSNGYIIKNTDNGTINPNQRPRCPVCSIPQDESTENSSEEEKIEKE